MFKLLVNVGINLFSLKGKIHYEVDLGLKIASYDYGNLQVNMKHPMKNGGDSTFHIPEHYQNHCCEHSLVHIMTYFQMSGCYRLYCLFNVKDCPVENVILVHLCEVKLAK
jgi:hypothetical protein